MAKVLMMSNKCKDCVFFRKKCVLGRKRPWNSLSCDDYRPYCLVCNYPEMFCNTCRNLGSRRMKPLEVDLKTNFKPVGPVHFDCVWQPPGQGRL